MGEKQNEPLDDLRVFLEKRAALQKIQEATHPPKLAPRPRPRACSKAATTAAAIILSAAAAICIYISYPRLKASLQPGQPIRSGTYDTDEETDRCIKNLWLLAGGRSSTSTAVCPVSELNYIAAAGGFYCPSPERHGLKELYYLPHYGVVAKKADK